MPKRKETEYQRIFDTLENQPKELLVKDPTTGWYLPFVANGNKYIVLKPDAIIGILRYSVMERLGILAGTGKNFVELMAVIDAIEKEAGSDKPIHEARKNILLTTHSLKKAVIDVKESRYPSGLFLATLFIVREGEDLSKFDEDIAQEKMKDWEAENGNMKSFFLLGMSGIKGYRAAYQKIYNDQKATFHKFTESSKDETEKP